MGNSNYTPPNVERRNNAVDEQGASEEKMDRSTGVPTEKVNTDVVSIHKSGIDDFRSFLAGDKYAGNLEERQKFQRDFMRSIWSMLELSQAQVKEIMDHFVITIAESPDMFKFENICAPLYSIESSLPADEVLRYKRFLLFITMYAENARDRARFLELYDMVKFEAMFGPTARQRIHNYVYG